MPILGISIPNMGMKRRGAASKAGKRVGLADALFSPVQQRVLGYLFAQPDRSFFATELIALAGGGSGAVQRQLARLAESGLVTVKRVGNQKHYQANPGSPIFEELCGIARKTVGLAGPLREALEPLAHRITAAFVFGSVAKGSDTATSDIDVLVLADDLDYAEVFEALQPAEARLGRSVNPTVYTPVEWRRRLKEKNGFAQAVLAQPKVFLFGAEAEVV